MRVVLRIVLPVVLVAGMVPALRDHGLLGHALADQQIVAEKKSPAPPTEKKPVETKAVADEENSCIQCHATLTEKDQQRFLVTAKDFAADIHWQKGMRCQDCHGGDPTVFEIKSHQAKEDFHVVKSPADVPEFCGTCHASIEYMRHYQPSPRTDQLSEYWTSGHGQRLKASGDPKVATCISCHNKPHGTAADQGKHGILPVADPAAPVYPTRVAKTCSRCHSDKEYMAGRQYHGKPLPCDEYAKWRRSVHAQALLEKGNLSAATCNNCHGNHGAVPPQVGSVANACGVCHGKIGKLFADTRMKHKFVEVGLPGCATCHDNHEIKKPTDAMVGMESGSVCSRCHGKGKFGATLAGAQAAKTLRDDLQKLRSGIAAAEETLNHADRLGMEVSQPRFELHKAVDSLVNARSLIHTFRVQPVAKAVADGEAVVANVQAQADHALEEHTTRRVWLAVSLVPIVLVIVLLLGYIRTLPVPQPQPESH